MVIVKVSCSDVPYLRQYFCNVSRDYTRPATTVSFYNFKSQNVKLSASNPKSKYVDYLSALSQISNCQSLGRKNKHEMLKTDGTFCNISNNKHTSNDCGKSAHCYESMLLNPGRNRFGSIRFGYYYYSKTHRFGSVRKFIFPGSTRFGLRFSHASWLGPVRLGSASSVRLLTPSRLNFCELGIVAIFYPFSQFCEINISPLSLQTQPNTAPDLFQTEVEYGEYGTGFVSRPCGTAHPLLPTHGSLLLLSL